MMANGRLDLSVLFESEGHLVLDEMRGAQIKEVFFRQRVQVVDGCVYLESADRPSEIRMQDYLMNTIFALREMSHLPSAESYVAGYQQAMRGLLRKIMVDKHKLTLFCDRQSTAIMNVERIDDDTRAALDYALYILRNIIIKDNVQNLFLHIICHAFPDLEPRLNEIKSQVQDGSLSFDVFLEVVRDYFDGLSLASTLHYGRDKVNSFLALINNALSCDGECWDLLGPGVVSKLICQSMGVLNTTWDDLSAISLHANDIDWSTLPRIVFERCVLLFDQDLQAKNSRSEMLSLQFFFLYHAQYNQCLLALTDPFLCDDRKRDARRAFFQGFLFPGTSDVFDRMLAIENNRRHQAFAASSITSALRFGDEEKDEKAIALPPRAGARRHVRFSSGV